MLVETLESRTLLSVAAVNPQIQADRLQIHSDLLQFKADLYARMTTITADVQAIKADAPNLATLPPLFRTLRGDIYAMHLQLGADLLAQSTAVRQDQAKILTDTQTFLADRGNPTARAADRQLLLADRIQLQNDEIAGLNARIATRRTMYNRISADLDLITTAVQNDPNASDQAKADAARFATDRTDGLNTILTDLNTVKADRTKLVADLTALQTQPPIV